MVTNSVLFSEELISELQRATPEVVLDLFVFVTFLGNTEFFILLLTVFYWGVSREKGISLLAVGLSAGVVTAGLKEAFASPRPPEALHLVEASHYGLPSGHALSSLVIYGSLVYTLGSLTRLQKVAAWLAIAVPIAVSRVFVGVHYPADTLGGWLAGGVLLALFVGYAELEVEKTLGIALAVSVPFLVLFSGVENVLFSFGGLAAVVAGWWISTEARSLDALTAKGGAALVVGLAVVFGGWTALSELSGIYVLPAAFLISLFVVNYLDLLGGAASFVRSRRSAGS